MEFVGLVNNARVYCLWEKSQQLRLKKKKKKKKKQVLNTDANESDPNGQ